MSGDPGRGVEGEFDEGACCVVGDCPAGVCAVAAHPARMQRLTLPENKLLSTSFRIVAFPRRSRPGITKGISQWRVPLMELQPPSGYLKHRIGLRFSRSQTRDPGAWIKYQDDHTWTTLRGMHYGKNEPEIARQFRSSKTGGGSVQHLGYTMQVCLTCQDVTKHRVIEMKTRAGSVVVKVCCKCSPEPRALPIRK